MKDFILVLAFAPIVVGVWMISVPAALIFVGLSVIAFMFLKAWVDAAKAMTKERRGGTS